MEMMEPIAVAVEVQQQGKCVLCGGDPSSGHEPKQETIEPTQWKRAKTSSIYDGAKNDLYPDGKQRSYATDGHHCLAWASFVNTKGQDVAARANHFLKKGGFDPNSPKNILHLPRDREALFASYSAAPPKPLQLHGSNSGFYVGCCKYLFRKAIRIVKPRDSRDCKGKEDTDYHKRLVEVFDYAVNYSCTQVVSFRWRVAKRKRHDDADAEYSRKYGKPRPAWQKLELKTGPF